MLLKVGWYMYWADGPRDGMIPGPSMCKRIPEKQDSGHDKNKPGMYEVSLVGAELGKGNPL